jgi:hypothetical protein
MWSRPSRRTHVAGHSAQRAAPAAARRTSGGTTAGAACIRQLVNRQAVLPKVRVLLERDLRASGEVTVEVAHVLMYQSNLPLAEIGRINENPKIEAHLRQSYEQRALSESSVLCRRDPLARMHGRSSTLVLIHGKRNDG